MDKRITCETCHVFRAFAEHSTEARTQPPGMLWALGKVRRHDQTGNPY